MKRVISSVLAVALPISTFSLGPIAYASTDIPVAYVDGFTAGNGEGDDAVVAIRLDSPATETTTVSYRTHFGSAHNGSTAITSGKFIDAREGTVTFAAGENYKEVVVPHYDVASSYEEVARTYAVQLYKASGNVMIDKERDLQLVAHKEDYKALSTGSHTILEDYADHFLDDDGMYQFPNATGVTWQSNAPYDGQYWNKIGVNSYSANLYSEIQTDDGTVDVYFDVNDNSGGHAYALNNDANGLASLSRTMGPRTISSTDRLRIAVQITNSWGYDYGQLNHYRFYASPIDTTAPTAQSLMFGGGNYGAGQEAIVAVRYNEIVRVTPGQEANVYLPVKADDGTIHKALYWQGSGTDVLAFKLTVPEGKKATPIKLDTADAFVGEAYVKDIAGNGFQQSSLATKVDAAGKLLLPTNQPADTFTFDGTKPVITNITADKSDIALKSGGFVDITLHFNRSVRLLGDAKLTLNNGAFATRTKSSVTASTHTFRYNVGSSATEDTAALKVTGLTGATVVGESESVGFAFPSGDNVQGNEIIIDNTKPTIHVNYVTPAGEYRQTHTIQVTATDGLSGMNADDAYQYGFSSGSYDQSELFGRNLVLSQDAPVKVYIKASDAAGNTQVVETTELMFDKSGPAINVSYPDAGAAKSKGTIDVSLADARSGLADSAEYAWYDAADAEVYSGTVTGLTGTGANAKRIQYAPQLDGHYYMELQASDIAGNPTTAKTNLIYIDKTAPTVNVSPAATEANQSSYDVAITAADPNGSNVDGSIRFIKYRWESGADIGAWIQASGNTVSFAYDNNGQTGESLLRVVAADDTGVEDSELNQIEQTYRFTFDHDGPIVTSTSAGFNSTIQAISIDVRASDALNGIGDVYYAYRTDAAPDPSGSDWSLLGASEATLTKNDGNGTFYLHVKAEDREGNAAYHVSEPFTMDNDAASGTINILQHFAKSPTVTAEVYSYASTDGLQYKLSEDGTNYTAYADFAPSVTYTFQDGSEGQKRLYVVLKDAVGNESDPVSDTVVLDLTPPTAEISYSATAPTKDSVVATITNVKDNYSSEANIVVSKRNHTFDANGAYDFLLTDGAGNQRVVTAAVANIDKAKATILFSPNQDLAPSKTKTVNVEASKVGHTVTTEYRILDGSNTEIKSYTAFPNPGAISLNFERPVSVEVRAIDGLGNTNILKSGMFHTDNVPPAAHISYSTTTRTAGDVVATITFDESAEITNNGGSDRYTFTENGEFRFEFVDEAGNSGNLLAMVDYIDRSKPSAAMTLSETDYTRGPILATVSVEALPNAKIGTAKFENAALTPQSTKKRTVRGEEVVYEAIYEIDRNGNLVVEVADVDTSVSENSSLLITNIDREPPVFEYTLVNPSPTKGNVDVTIQARDAKSGPVTVASEPVAPKNGVYTFTENGSYVFTLRDALGNQKEYAVVIDTIDRDIQPQIRYSKDTYTNQDVVATVFSEDEELVVLNNAGSGNYTFTANGSFEFEVSDAAGNTGKIAASVDWINKTGFDFEVVPSTRAQTNQPMLLSIEPSAPIAEVVSLEGLQPQAGGPNQFSISANGRYTFTVTDVYGNAKEITYYVGNVDMTAPKLDYTLGLDTATGRIVLKEGEAIASDSRSIRIAFAPGEKVSFTAYDPTLEFDAGAGAFLAKANGTYAFEARDAAGNVTTKTIALTRIDGTPPTPTIEYSTTAPTNGSVVATVKSDEPILVANNYNKPQRAFAENGTYTFLVSDLAGNQTEITADVRNIDKKPPVVNVAYSTKEKTNGNVTATLASNEPFYVVRETATKVEVGEKYTYTFESNQTAFFTVKDEVGNETVVFAKVGNIDKQAPNLLFRTDGPILVRAGDASHDFAQHAYSDSVDTNRIAVDTSAVDFGKTGSYEAIYTVYDDAGNARQSKKAVDIIDPSEPLLTRMNGVNPAVDTYFKTGRIAIDVRNAHDQVSIYYLPQKTDITSVKQSGTKLNGTLLETNRSGWISILIVDKDLNKKFYQIFVSPQP